MHRHQAYTNGFSARKKDDDVFVPSDRSELDGRFAYNIHDLEDEKTSVPYGHSARWNARSNAHRARQRLKILLISGGLLFLWCIWHFTGSTFTRPSRPPPLEIETVRYYDLEDVQGSSAGWEREERVLLCTPLRDAETHLHMFFSHLRNFTYPHNLIDLGFLVSDSKDKTQEVLINLLEELQADPDPKMPYGEISIIRKDFGQQVNQDVESRHGFAAQASRRKLMAQARNWLLSASLRPYHSWVYWRDADVETAPFTILEDLMRHNKDVIVPNVWRPLPDWLGGEQPYDLNSWQESDTALALADTLDEDAVIVEGYAEYATWRPHLAYLRDPYGDPDMEMEIDGVGGVSILAKARVFRAGVHFPAFSFEKHAETEGFGKMARKMDFSVVGLPHYTVWHLYEPSVDDIRHMEEMEQERKEREQEEKERADRAKKIKEEFKDTGSQWEKDKADMAEKIKQEEKEQEAKAGGPANAQAPKDPVDQKGGDKGESQSEKKPAGKAEPKKDAKADAKDNKPDAKDGADKEKKPSPKDEKKPEAKPETKDNAKSDAKSDTKPDKKPKSKPEEKSNAKADDKPAAKGDGAADSKPDSKSNTKAESRFKNKPANSDTEAEKPLERTDSKPGKGGETKAESKGKDDSKPISQKDTNDNVKSDSKPDSKADIKPEKKKTETKGDTESKPEADSKPKAKEP